MSVKYFIISEPKGLASCHACGEGKHYRCLSCKRFVCNRSDSCSIVASEETPDWKAGSYVSFCLSCKPKRVAAGSGITGGSSKTKDAENHSGSDTKKSKASRSTITRTRHQGKRKCLHLQQRVAVINYAKEHPTLSSRMIADIEAGKTQIQSILRGRESIMAL